MPLLLNIETSTRICSVALSDSGKILALKELGGEYTHAENLTLFIEEVVKEGGCQFESLDAVAVGKGPGSYTGLRIGVSVAKGLCYALNKPLIAIGTLEALFGACPKKQIPDILYCPMLDARRLEVYTALYDSLGTERVPVHAKILDESSFGEFLEKGKVVFFGDGAEKFKALTSHPNALFEDHVFPSATFIAQLAEKAWVKKQFEDVAYFEPYYLKDFMAGKKANAAGS
jgi:tRNA threonylcarbamoyladenosine biosynthesis protein TsaB